MPTAAWINDDDGYADPLSCPKGTDCDDNDPAVFRGSVGCEDCKDVDGDRYLAYDPDTCSLGTDCDDSDAEKNPGKGNCNKCEDRDNDGYFAKSLLCPEGNDCDDSDWDRNPGKEEVCDGKDNNCAGGTDEGCCVISNLMVLPSEVWPVLSSSILLQLQILSGRNPKADIIIDLTKPAPPNGCTVNLNVEAVSNSGGHNHDVGRPTGILNEKTLSFSYGDTGPESVTYISSKVSGWEKISAKALESGHELETMVTVRVPLLSAMSMSVYYRLTGQTTTHPDNHYGTFGTTTNAYLMAMDYYSQFNATLGINDMSLIFGGLFDMNNNWKTPHSLHRVGKSIDVDRKALNLITGQYVYVDIERLTRIVKKRNGKRIPESTIHYEFP